MNSTENRMSSNVQMTLLVVTSFALIVFIWRMVPIYDGMKLVASFFAGASFMFIIYIFTEYLCFFKPITSSLMVIIITVIVFLTFPLASNVLHDIQKRDYITSYPADNKIYVQITSDIDFVHYGSIGSDWIFEHYLNGKKFKDGDVLAVNVSSPFSIKSRFIEQDSIDDIGETTSREYNYSSNENYKKTLTISQSVHVVENGGRRYAGATADINVRYTLKRVVPESLGYWDLLFYAADRSKYVFAVFITCGQVLSIGIVAFVIVVGRKKKLLAEEQDRIRKERELLIQRNSFLESLQGQSIRQAAGVPSHISFINGLPKDNNDAQYGSFTVYRSSKGSCYHDKKGCCSARYPVHYFIAMNRLRPCSRCCANRGRVPQWYIQYNALKKQAALLKIDIPE